MLGYRIDLHKEPPEAEKPARRAAFIKLIECIHNLAIRNREEYRWFYMGYCIGKHQTYGWIMRNK